MDYSYTWARGVGNTTATDPSLTANCVCRLVFGSLALLASWIPFKLLRRNGEFAACVMVSVNWILVLFLVVNAAIWTSDDIETSWAGRGWCDIQMYGQFAMTTVYSACVCTIMRRLARQVGDLRTAGLSAREKRNRLFVESLITFPIPVLQVCLTPFVQAHPYTLMPVTGCGKALDGNVIYLMFYIVPSPIYTAAACIYACKWPVLVVSTRTRMLTSD